ncbi:MAG: oligosaccharide flippase family protein [Phycisphaera sp.]|nr:oligosaccharide flippase family protein [Phycisphaera sp.]
MLTQHAARGATLMLAASLFGRIAALAAQIVTGLLLADEQFGVFAMAIGIQAIAGILQGGNALSYLVTLPPSGRRFRTGTVFAISNGFYLVGVVPMLVLAPTIANHFEEPAIVELLWILGVTMMLSPIRFVLRAKLNARLAFGASALASAINNLFVYPLTIVLAIWLRDATALAIPVLVGAVAEIAFLWIKARPASTDFRPRRRFVRPLLYQFRWLAAGAVMMSLFSSGDYMIAEFLVETAVLGTYYFGYQLAVQPGRIFTTTVLNILVPVVKRLSHDRDRLVAALRRLLSTGGFAIAAINLSMLAMIEPLERVIWNEKWAGVVFTVQILSIGLTFTTILGIGMSPLMAQRRYPESVFCGGIRAVFMMAGAAIGAVLWGTPDGISLAVTGGMLIASVLGIGFVLRAYEVPVTGAMLHLTRSTVPVIVAGGIAAVVGHSLLDGSTGRASGVIALGAAGATYLVLLPVALLLIPNDTRTEIVRLLPGPLRRRLPGGNAQSETQES